MRKLLIVLFLLFSLMITAALFSCTGEKTPDRTDVSDISDSAGAIASGDVALTSQTETRTEPVIQTGDTSLTTERPVTTPKTAESTIATGVTAITTGAKTEPAVTTKEATSVTTAVVTPAETLVTLSDTVTEKPEVTTEKVLINIPDPNAEKIVYLTFDDGPGKYTSQLLDVLDKYNVKATFFVVNTRYTDLITREAEEGHTVAVHTYTHDYSKVYASEEAYFEDLDAMNEVIKEKTGSYSKLIRFPGGSSNSVSKNYSDGIMTRLTAEVIERGYQYFDWNVSAGDAGGAKTADEVFNNVTAGIKKYKKSVVLQHDIKGFSVEAVERIIIWGLENGYTFMPLTIDSYAAHHRLNN